MNNIERYIGILDTNKLCQYLQITGWKELARLFEQQVRQFVNVENEEVVLVPLSKDFSDYNQVMYRTLSIIASYEDKTLMGMLNHLLNPSSDILKLRIADERTMSGAISLMAMQNNIEYIKSMLSAVCLDILYPSSFHKKVAIKEVQEQVAKYQFGQTEVGSYILNLICPLGYYQYEMFQEGNDELPLGRRININLLKDIAVVQESARDRSSQLMDAVGSGEVSVNFLSALGNLYEENRDTEFSIVAQWNAYVPNVNEVLGGVELQPRCIDFVQDVIETCTPQEEQNIVKSFYGKITRIDGAPNIDDRQYIAATVASIGDQGQQINVKVILNNDAYFHIVDNAFQHGANVRVSGIYRSTIRTNTLVDAQIEQLDE